MEDRLSRTELIKLLIQERNHHFIHPHQVAVKFFYSLAGTITALLLALLFKHNQLAQFKLFISNNSLWFSIFTLMIFIGYSVIIWGIIEHTSLHKNQRKRIESALEYLISVNKKQYSFDEFWDKFGLVNLKYNKYQTSKNQTGLLVAEPDTRNWIKYHDRKLELGIALIFIGILGGCILIFSTST